MISTKEVRSVTGTAISPSLVNTKMRNHFKEYCEHTGIHGLIYLTEKRSKYERWLWFLLITTSVVACCYVIGRIYEKYDKSPVIVTFATSESEIFTIPFPAVTICPLTITSALELNLSKVIANNQLGYFDYETGEIVSGPTVTESEKINTQYMSLLCDEADKISDKNNTFKDDFFKVLHKCRVKVFKELCQFMGDEVYHCQRFFDLTILDQGLCHTFNMLTPEDIFRDNVVNYWFTRDNISTDWDVDTGYKNTSKINAFPYRALHSGAENGLEITLVQNDDDIDYMCVKDVQGYKVTIHAPYSIPSPKMQYFYVSFGTVVAASVQPKMMTTSEEVKSFDPVARECYLSTEKYLKYFKIYSPHNCKLECLSNYTSRLCGCVGFYMPRDKSIPICGNNMSDCMLYASRVLKADLIVKMANAEDDTPNLICDCMPLCTDLSYNVEQSQSEWDWTKQYIRPSQKRFNPMTSLMSRGVKRAKLNVYFKNSKFMKSERTALYGAIDFLANFGGLLGLFTGFSLLSLAEIIYFLTVRIIFNMKRYKVSDGTAK